MKPNVPPDLMPPHLRKLASELGLGPMQDFPAGKIHPADEGALKIAVGTDQGQVIINFGVRVAWLGLPPADARLLAKALLKQADLAERAG